MINTQKMLYDYLRGFWDQSAYPASIVYYSPDLDKINEIKDENVIIAIERRDIDLNTIGSDIDKTTQIIESLLIHCYINKPNSTFRSNSDYIVSVVNEIKSVIKNNVDNYFSFLNFVSDTVGSDPGGWTVNEEENTDVSVISSLDLHYKIAKIYINRKDTPASIVYDFANSHASGKISLYVYYEDLLSEVWVANSTWDEYIRLILEDGELRHGDYPGTKICDLSMSNWHHLTITFDCNSNWDVEVDGTLYSGFNFKGSPSSMSAFAFLGQVLDDSYPKSCYIDAVDFSWADGYFTNRNKTQYRDYFLRFSKLNYILEENSKIHAILGMDVMYYDD